MQRITGKKKRALDSLLSGGTVTEASAAAGVDRVTLWRWTNDADFADALRTVSEGAITTAARRLQLATDRAIDAIEDALADGSPRGTSARLRAADMVLSHAERLAELVDILPRIDALERRQNESSNG
jgi:phage terminase small subunit